jgi:hypothetical protein
MKALKTELTLEPQSTEDRLEDWTWWFMLLMPAIQEVEIGKTAVQGQPKQKVSETSISINKPGMVVSTYDPSYVGGRDRRITVQAAPGEKCRTLSEK